MTAVRWTLGGGEGATVPTASTCVYAPHGRVHCTAVGFRSLPLLLTPAAGD